MVKKRRQTTPLREPSPRRLWSSVPDAMPADTSSTEGTTIDAVTTNSLKALQSEDERKVMDIVDKLRRTGLSGVVELPQLVVSGTGVSFNDTTG